MLYFPYIAQLVPHVVLYIWMLFTALENNVYHGFSERMPSTSFCFSMAGDIHHFFAMAVLENIGLGWSLETSYSTPICLILYELLYFPYSTHTSALTNT